MHRYMYIYTDLYTHAYKCTHIYAYIHMTRGNFNHFSCARTCGLNFIQPFLQRPKCGEVIVKTWNLRFSITSFQDIELWRGGNKYIVTFTICLYATNAKIRMQVLLCVFQMLPIYLTMQKACLLSWCLLHRLQLAIYSQTGSCTAELQESRTGRALWAPRLPQQQDLHQTWPNKQFPWLVSDLPWADTEALFFGVTALPSSKKKQPCSFTTISTFSWWTWLIRAHGFKSSQREGWRYKQSMIT